ncbi:MAG: hypothetical protein KatS3mg077_0042 [Candidatus Binatia bacterium]|nr:MAG: hypothetical protein KatS3mg077_0042 [Candidatus Binatia bacterium]
MTKKLWILLSFVAMGLTAGHVRAVRAVDARSEAAEASVTLQIEGMTCASCAVAVRTALRKLDGVREARVSVADKKAEVEYDPAKVSPAALVEAVNRLGYQARLAPEQ